MYLKLIQAESSTAMTAALDKISETEQINVALERSLNDSEDPKLKKAEKEEDDLILSQVPDPEPSVSGAVVNEDGCSIE